MAITRATNLAGLGTVFDALTDGGGLSISGISTFTDLNVTRANITGVSTLGITTITTALAGDPEILNLNAASSANSTNLNLSINNGNTAQAGLRLDNSGSLHLRTYDSGQLNNRLTIRSNGWLGIGLTNPSQKLHVTASSGVNNCIRAELSGTASYETNAGYFVNTDTGTGVSRGLYVSGTDYGLWVNSGTSVFGSNIGVGASSTGVPYGITIQQGATDPYKLGWVDGGGTKRGAILVNPANDELQFLGGSSENLGFSITSSGAPKLYGDIQVSAGASMSASSSDSEFSIYSGGTYRGGQITFVAGQRSYAGLIFRSGATGAHSEWSRLNGSGDWLWGKTAISVGSVGAEIRGSQGSYFVNVVSDNYVLDLNRKTTDGGLIAFRQDNNVEGTISVSGSTVSYNGGHLSRFAQLLDGSRQEILKGTILSNLDELSEWKLLETQMEEIKEIQVETYVVGVGTTVGIATTSIITDAKVPYGGISDVGVTTTAIFDGKEYTGVVVMDLNEQLNRLKVSDVEGDPNVAGVFQEWDDDDGVHTQDLICAMTGDFPVRIGAGVTVTRGDLLMSAGDGTAKPQGDDIIRSKTIAKVISTVHTITYDDGTFCVPCVLMAC